MASLTIRRIDDEVYARLKERAAHHGVSLEEEVGRILLRAVTAARKGSATSRSSASVTKGSSSSDPIDPATSR